MTSLQDRTRFEPSEVEPRIVERWLASRLHHPDPEGTADENYSIAIPPPNVTGVLHMGHALNGSIQDTLDPLPAHARAAGEVDPRHRPRGDRDPEAGRAPAAGRGHEPRGDRARGVRRARVAMARAVRRHDHRAVQAPRRHGGLRGRALHARRALRAGGHEGLRRPLRQGPDLPRPLPRQLGPGVALGHLRPRGRGPRGHRRRSSTSPTRSRTATARSWSPPCARRRCWPTPRSRSTPRTSATATSSARRRCCPSSGAT